MLHHTHIYDHKPDIYDHKPDSMHYLQGQYGLVMSLNTIRHILNMITTKLLFFSTSA